MGREYRAEATRLTLDLQVSRLAAAQFGVFTRAQAMHFGATKDMVRHRLTYGRWQRMAPNVFRIAGTAPSWRQALMSACLAWGEGAVVSHRAAAALWHLTGFETDAVELTVPEARQRRKGPGLIHRNALYPPDVTFVESIPVTTPARTLIDVASVASPGAVGEALDDALRRGLVSISRLRWRLDEVGGRGGRRGIGVLRSLLDERTASSVPQSVFETRLLRLLKRAGLPQPAVQHEIRSHGRLVAIVDCAYPRERLAIEADGYRWHSGRTKWHQDRRRLNELTLMGWRVIHVTWADLSRRPAAVLDSIARALAGGPGVDSIAQTTAGDPGDRPTAGRS